MLNGFIVKFLFKICFKCCVVVRAGVYAYACICICMYTYSCVYNNFTAKCSNLILLITLRFAFL